MKSLNLFLIILLVAAGTFTSTQAQPSASDNTTTAIQADNPNHNYALLVRNFNHLKAAIKTVAMLTEEGRTVTHFEVVLCGKKITQINENRDLVKKAQRTGITVTACGMSMNKFSMKKADLPDGVRVVKNGLIHIFDLQEQGYKTITL